MPPRKLSDADKQEVIERYRSSNETAATLASHYGVSNSTISRLLKTGLPEAEYEALIQQKRGRSSGEATATEAVISSSIAAEPTPASLDRAVSATEPPHLKPTLQETEPEKIEPQTEQSQPLRPASKPEAPIRRVRKRSSAADNSATEALPEPAIASLEPGLTQKFEPGLRQAELTNGLTETQLEPEAMLGNLPVENLPVEMDVLEEILDEEISDESDDLDSDLDDEDEDDEDDDEPLAEGALLVNRQGRSTQIRVLPLSDASIPRTCYLVVDRSAELVARPLREFGDLGSIPDEETQAKTLPVFDNHRVAKRYSNPRTQRVIKLPDGKVLQRTSSHLQAKGITRLLIDGQVYALV